MAHPHKRIYAIIQMTPEQDEEDRHWQAELINRVGVVNEYNENNAPIHHPPTDPEEHHKFWEEYKANLKPYKLIQEQILGRWVLDFRPNLA